MSESKQIANRYTLGKLIGRGGMGQVYQGLDLQTNTPVAIKVLRPDTAYTTPELVERFRREGEALRRLNHPNIVKVLDIIDEGDQNGEQYHYIVMAYVAGGSLAGLLKRQPQLPVERALAIALELSDALARTHHLNIVHRDIKPGNILLAEDGTPLLTDFGLAYMRDRERLTLAEAVVGTFAYLSPEACGGHTPDERSDLWSFGVVLYEMLAGRPPFQGDSPAEVVREIIDVTPLKVSVYRNDVPPALDNLVQRLMMKDAVARIGSFRQVGAELEAIMRGTRIPQWEPSPSPTQADAAGTSSAQPSALTLHLWMKLHIPRLPGQWIDRQRLYDRLDQVKAGKIAILSAPPGYGKTTLLVSWLRHSGWKNAVWISLDVGDNDPVRFWSYLVAALQMIPACKGVGAGIVELIRSPQPPPLGAGLTMLLNEITQVSEDLLLVLDDYHTITNAAIHSGMEFCLEHLPPHLHLVVASRTAPAFALPRYRARGRLVELRAGDLRFTRQEAHVFLQQAAHQQLSADDIAVLEQRTEGWIAGMQLATLLMEGMEGCEDAHAFVQSFSGDQHYILDYLTEEVLRRQPEPVQSFLLQSAILDRMTAPLCDAVLEIGGWKSDIPDSQGMLAHLEQANLFVVPLDHRREWYRYHQLFAELLRGRLRQANPEQYRRLHRRAAEWFAAHTMPDEAIKHALAGEDLNRAAELVEANQRALIERGEVATLRTWLYALPQDVVLACPSLCLGYAWLELYQSRFEQAGKWADLACAAMGPQPDDALRSQVDAVRATVAINQKDYGRATELSRRALQHLPPELDALRSVVNLNLGDAYTEQGDIAAAADAYRDAFDAAPLSGNHTLEAVIIGSLGGLYLGQGRLCQAESILQQALLIEKDMLARGGPPLLAAGKPLAFLTGIYIEWNQLDTAAQLGARAVDYCRRWGHAEHLMDAYVQMIHLRHAQGDAQGSLDMLGQAQTLVKDVERTVHLTGDDRAKARFAMLRRSASLAEAYLRLKRREPDFVERWLAHADAARDPALPYYTYVVDNVRAPYWLLCGQPDQAIPVLKRLIHISHERGWMKREVDELVLLACAEQASGNSPTARATLEHAVLLAEPEGYVRLFADKGELLGDLMVELARRPSPVAPAYLKQLLGAFPTLRQGSSGETRADLVEPLTEREQQILRLLVADRTYPEIATELYLSLNTVKTHMKRLYAKLGVDSRMAAVEKAKSTRLINDGTMQDH